MQTGRPVYSVTLLVREVKRLLEASYASIQVEGEISGLSRPASGHQYFSIKDENSQLRCVFFKNSSRLCPVKLTDGMQVILSARVSLYEQRGDFQLIVQSVVESGEGLLRKKFEQLKVRLGAEGLFDIAHKKALPALPKRVGIITSASGAALHDIISVFKRRFPAIELLIYPSTVQGELAAEALAKAIQTANLRNECDVLILARGGGSLEDLWPFNEEVVAQAIYSSRLPLVSAVGHETDFSISDLVADVRAATPTAAAELLSPDRIQLINACTSLQTRLFNNIHRRQENAAQRLDLLQARLISFNRQVIHDRHRYQLLTDRFLRYSASMITDRRYQLSGLVSRIHRPDQALRQRMQYCQNLDRQLLQGSEKILASASYRYALLQQRLSHNQLTNQLTGKSIHYDGIHKRLWNKIPALIQDRRTMLEKQAFALQTLSPLQTLSRGYATLQFPDSKEIVSSVTQTNIGDQLQANLQDGSLYCTIIDINQNVIKESK